MYNSIFVWKFGSTFPKMFSKCWSWTHSHMCVVLRSQPASVPRVNSRLMTLAQLLTITCNKQRPLYHEDFQSRDKAKCKFQVLRFFNLNHGVFPESHIRNQITFRVQMWSPSSRFLLVMRRDQGIMSLLVLSCYQGSLIPLLCCVDLECMGLGVSVC